MTKKYHILLAILILFSIFKGLVWVGFVPLWHFPDEQAHFAQIAANVEKGSMPPYPGQLGDLSKEIFTSEQLLGVVRDWAGNNKYTYHPEYNIPYTQSYEGAYEKKIASLPTSFRKEMVKKEAANYPPLYYTLGSIPYRLVYQYDLFTRLFAVRLFTVIFSILLILLSYKFFRYIFLEDQLTALIGSSLVSMHPMLSFVSSGVNSDNLYNLLFLYGLVLGIRLLKKPLDTQSIMAIALLTIGCMMTKPQGILIIYVYIFPIIYQLLTGKLHTVYKIIGGVGLFAFLVKGYQLITSGNQFLPDIPYDAFRKISLSSLIEHFRWTVEKSYRETLPWYFGVFKWLGVVLPSMARRIINLILLCSGIGIGISLVTSMMHKFWEKNILVIYLLYLTIGYFLLLTEWNYLFFLTKHFSFGIQGRYYFPLLPVHVAIILIGLISFGRNLRMKHIIGLFVLIGEAILQLIGLTTVLSSYYDMNSFVSFFIQASQYKPMFFKYPYLFVYFTFYLISMGLLISCFIKELLHEKKS